MSINQQIIDAVDEKIYQMNEEPPLRWIYAVVKNLSFKYDLTYNEMNKIYLERIKTRIDVLSYREKICFLFKQVELKANNGSLTEEEINTIFPMPVRT